MALPPAGKRFVKGQSGNPGGKPRAAIAMARLIAEKTRDGAELVEYALDVVRDIKGRADDPKSWAYCHNWLTERVAGKAQQTVTIVDDTERAPLDDRELTEAELKVLAKLDDVVEGKTAAPVLRLIPGVRPTDGNDSDGGAQ